MLSKMAENIKFNISESIRVKESLLNEKTQEAILRIAETMILSLKSGHKILLCGNGGSASDALHIAAELVGRFKTERCALPAIALSANVSNLTAIGNDYGYEHVFARQVEGLGMEDDVFIGLSTSGNSANVVKAAKVAKAKKMKVCCLVGAKNCALDDDSYLTLHVPSTDTARIQECHILIGHILCGLVDDAFNS